MAICMPGNSQNKTQATEAPVAAFLSNIKDEQQREDAEHLCRIMGKVTGKPTVMRGPSIIGFDQYHYKYESGREGDMGAIGFSPRKLSLSIYLVDGFEKYVEPLSRLGPHKTGKACLYIKHLSGVDIKVPEGLIMSSYQYVMLCKNEMHCAE